MSESVKAKDHVENTAEEHSYLPSLASSGVNHVLAGIMKMTNRGKYDDTGPTIDIEEPSMIPVLQ